ncbi:U3 small nucleolar RNA-associated protein 14 homolog A [Centruroides vittatus]|uniref:U3 small nucleolar RNA-associated protein 14 homolog A n=1 Tax=Centruroides vittatus TaxID=120091 RepID=UPI0035103848
MEELEEVNDISASEDEGDDERRHKKMLEAINTLSGKRGHKRAYRKEPSNEISEFNLSEGNRGKVKLHELLASLKKTPSHAAIKKQLGATIRRRKILNVPLETEEALKIKRKVAYDKVSKEVSLWDDIVQANRVAEQIEFPLQRPDISIRPASEYIKKFKPKTPMEIEINNVLNANGDILMEDKSNLASLDEEEMQALNVQEVKKSLREIQRARALLSYAQSKNRRQNKIKSKKYHRILKKERLQKEMKEFEKLKQESPTKAAEKLKELEKLRILERMTLKHKSTGKWAKHKMLRAKYDKESRDEISAQLELGRQLTQKVITNEDSDDDDADGDLKLSFGVNKTENGKTLNDYKESINLLKNPIECISADEVNKGYIERAKQVSIKEIIKQDAEENCSDADENEESLIDETLIRKTKMEDFNNMEEIPVESSTEWFKTPKTKINSDVKLKQNKRDEKTCNKKKNENSFLDSELNVVELKSRKSQLVECEAIDEEELDALSDGENKQDLAESYWDSEIIKEFEAEKSAAIEKDKPKDVDTFLPGWGNWGGTGIKVSKKRRRRFIIKAPPAPPRKDNALGNVIINEKHNEKIKQFQVNEIPFPFSSVQQFESTLRQPVGRTWNPETAFQRAIAPKIVTKMGQIIDPIDSDALLKKLKEDEIKEGFTKPNKEGFTKPNKRKVVVTKQNNKKKKLNKKIQNGI